MVFYFVSDVVEPPTTLFMGLDKYENEDLIKFGWPEDVWFHVVKVTILQTLSILMTPIIVGVFCARVPQTEARTNFGRGQAVIGTAATLVIKF